LPSGSKPMMVPLMRQFYHRLASSAATVWGADPVGARHLKKLSRM
jgi:hypothetical protein